MTNSLTNTDPWKPTEPLETLELLSNPIMIADADLIVRYVNPSAYDQF